ncbi:MAG: hypothetical protein ACYTKD_29765 [Planctomycetota bacterium]|jgi:hypothetical protein
MRITMVEVPKAQFNERMGRMLFAGRLRFSLRQDHSWVEACEARALQRCAWFVSLDVLPTGAEFECEEEHWDACVAVLLEATGMAEEDASKARDAARRSEDLAAQADEKDESDTEARAQILLERAQRLIRRGKRPQ